MKRKLAFIFLPLLLLVALVSTVVALNSKNSSELRSISSESELYSFYLGHSSIKDSLWFRLLTLPFSLAYNDSSYSYISTYDIALDDDIYWDDADDIAVNGGMKATDLNGESSEISTKNSTKDYSKTNIQVENVDEADLLKTDGNYVYSLSGTDVLISDVSDRSAPRVVSCICGDLMTTPEELLLSGDSLVVISSESIAGVSRYSSLRNTVVSVFDIKDRETPVLKKTLTLPEPYETSRLIGNQVYIFSSGALRLADAKVIATGHTDPTVSRVYEEDNEKKEFPLDSIKYLKSLDSRTLSLIATLDLEHPEQTASVQPFLMDFENAYVSEASIYLADYRYNSCSTGSAPELLKRLFLSPWGVIGFVEDSTIFSCSDGSKTALYKFSIEPSGVSFVASASLPGKTLSQYSFDEKSGHLRIALDDHGTSWNVGALSGGAENGTYIAILDENLKLLGKTDYFGENETMRASRFLGDKAYVVTYYNTDPLFVVDLADEKNPKVLGELKIPGYSTYLHPYDATHLIGIGVDTEEDVIRDSATGRTVRTTSRVTGMKIALFDVSDLKNPKELSKIHLGDSRTTSAILTNPKALLFSKEKSLLAIPINNFSEDVKLDISNVENNSEIESAFSTLSKKATSEGYLVLNLDLDSGFSQKGIITHDASRLLRGAYIESDLLTVSENFLKFNALSDLSPVSSLNLAASKASSNPNNSNTNSKIGE